MRIVKAGEKGVDFSFARPPAARLVELGYTFVVGYISLPPASSGKNITKAECDAYLAAGLKVLLVWEMDAARPDKGATYGAIDGKGAAIRAAALGYPVDVPILSAADLNSFAANIDRHEAYMRAFAANCAPYPHEIGEYADTDLLARTAGLWRIGWVPLGAWAWSGTSYKDALAKSKAVGAHVVQGKGFYIDNMWAVDPNEAINDFPAWSLTPDPQPQPEDDMLRLLVPTDNPAQFFAMCTPQGAALRCEWTGDLERIEFYRNAHPAGTVPFGMSLTVAAFRNVSLDGPLPPGMKAEDFGNPAEIHKREDAPAGGTVDTVARSGLAQLNDAVGRNGQEIHEVKTNLIKAGGG